MKKKIMTVLLCVCLISSLICAPVYAAGLKDSTGSLSYITDTTSYTQEQYLNPVELFDRSVNITVSNDKMVQLACESFLAMAKASVRKPAKYDASKRILSTSLGKDTIQYRLTDYAYQSELNKALKQTISSDSLEFTNFSVKYDGDKAIASIVESYTYYINDGFDGESFRRKMYNFELQSVDKQWQITNVTTDDAWELAADFEYKPIDAKAAVSNLLAENAEIMANPSVVDEKKVDEVKADKDELYGTLETTYSWTYNASNAVTYAANHYAATSNSVFGYTAGNDCQNFASQCVWAGLGGSGTSKTNRPAVPTSRAGTGAFNVWCAGQNTTYYSEYYFNWAWDNVCSFMKLMVASTSSAEGPYGNGYYSSGVQNAGVGDVLAVNWAGTPSESSMDHAMFVTQVSGTYGSRTTSDVKIAAHTSATNSAYQTLSSYTSTSINNFGRSAIWNGYYTVAQ